SSFGLLQDANDLLFVESTLAHDSSSPWAGHSKWEKSHFVWTTLRGAGQVLIPDVDLYRYRLATAAVAMLLLLYGLIWESE
ncbi:MAG: hypothetical protein WA628_12970, partial [Terriglobales bacterium]